MDLLYKPLLDSTNNAQGMDLLLADGDYKRVSQRGT
jgi:hypothetical protein